MVLSFEMRSAILLLAASLLVPPTAPPAHAGATSPPLVLATAVGAAAPGGRAVTFTGTFDFANALQLGFPIDLVVFQGARFVRYPFAGGPVTGTSPELVDGALAQAEVAALLAEGAAVDPGVEVVTLVADRIRVTLPASFTAGPTTAVVFAVLTDGTVLSNPIDFVLP